MALNPFKDSNLKDLQDNILDFFRDRFGGFLSSLKSRLQFLRKKGKERITIMFIPHSEKRIVNFHISIFAIFMIVGLLVGTITVTSVFIINHTSTIKEISKLKIFGSNTKIQIAKYKEEINRLYDIFQKFKPEITYLYSLIPGNDVDSLWAKGGVPNPALQAENETTDTPPVEVLNIEEMERELKTTKELMEKIKVFLAERKKIIENTPSLWPVDGYIISRFGERTSPYTFKKEYHPGIDIAAFPGAEIKATAPGKVENIWWDPIYGLSVAVAHKYGFITVYSHCQRVSVTMDQKITKGETIAYVGKTGKATRPACFYQIKIGTEFVDPAPYINKIAL